jgi:hypothetical protein
VREGLSVGLLGLAWAGYHDRLIRVRAERPMLRLLCYLHCSIHYMGLTSILARILPETERWVDVHKEAG